MVVARLILVFLNTPVEKLIFFSMISTEAKISLNRLFLSFSKTWNYFVRRQLKMVSLILQTRVPWVSSYDFFHCFCLDYYIR